jgi:Tol biopolymer transport system component
MISADALTAVCRVGTLKERQGLGGSMKNRALVGAIAALLVMSSCASSDTDRPQDAGTTQAGSSPAAASSASQHPFADEKAWIAYQTDRSGSEGVWLIHPDGTEDHQIAQDAGGAQLLPDWSPDGSRLVFTTRGGSTEPLYEHDLAQQKSRQLFACTDPCLGDDEPAYSPDGKKVAFIRALGPFTGDLPKDCGLWIGDPTTGQVRQITSNTKPRCDREYMPRWAPDGSRLTYWRQPPEGGEPTATAVFIINADGRKDRRLTKPSLVAGEPDWSPDGKWIVFATHPLNQFQCCEQSNLYRIHPDGSGLQQLTKFEGTDLRATQPRYGPDGKWILFTSVTPSSRTLSALPADGGQPVAITTSGIYTHSTWQPSS